MVSEWPTVRLGDYVDSSLGKMLDANKNKGTLAPYLGNSNVRWGQFDLADLAQMKFEPHEAERYGIRDGDLIVCEGGEPGRCAIWREQLPGMKIQKALHRVRPKNGLNNYYLFYWFMHAGRTGHLEPYFTGTTIKHLTGKALAELQIPLPPLKEQRAIAETLGALDDRIDNLRQTNATLEAIAQSLFKSRFVDFDGVPPEGMQESELGLIPQGWRAGTIGEVADVIDCLHAKKPELLNEGKPYLQLNCVREDGLLETIAAAFISDADYEKWVSRVEAKAGDCVITNVGRVGAVAQVPDSFKTAIGRNMTAIRPNKNFPSTFLIELLLSEFMRGEIESKTDAGTILSALNVKSIPKLRFVQPPDALIQKFQNDARPLRATMEANLQRSYTLAALRDALLPRLISGRLRVGTT